MRKIAPLLAVLTIATACGGPDRALTPVDAAREAQIKQLDALGIKKALPPGEMLTERQIEWLIEAKRRGETRSAETPTNERGPDALFSGGLDWEAAFGAGMNQFDDDCRHVGLGFSFTFYGNTYSSVWVNSNGNMTFNGCNTAYWQSYVPDGGWALVAPLYGDWNPAWAGDVYYNVLGTAPNRRFVATWHVVPEYSHGGSNTFQAILYEGSNNIQFGYNGLTTDGYSWYGGITFNVGISSGTGSWINSASGSAIPGLNGTNLCYKPAGGGYGASAGSCAPSDATPPVITPNVTGTLGANGWYTGNVSVSWSVTDPESPVTSQSGCGATTLTSDSDGATYTCTATSLGGTSSNSVKVKRDATLPTVTYSGNAGTYTIAQSVSITCAAADATNPGSGLASHTCQDVAGAAYTFNVGPNSYSASATDNAGNEGTGETSFTVTVDNNSLCELTQQFVTKAGVANSLCAKLNAAAAARARGNGVASSNILQAYVNEVAAQTGKSITAAQAAILSAYAMML